MANVLPAFSVCYDDVLVVQMLSCSQLKYKYFFFNFFQLSTLLNCHLVSCCFFCTYAINGFTIDHKFSCFIFIFVKYFNNLFVSSNPLPDILLNLCLIYGGNFFPQHISTVFFLLYHAQVNAVQNFLWKLFPKDFVC